MKNKNVLITCGPTWVAIDSMRVLSNKSSGRLGAMLALECLKRQAKVTLLEGPVERRLQNSRINIKAFTFFDELEKLLNAELKKKYDVIIHAAAISDYKPADVIKVKIRSNLKQLMLKLVPTKKLINIIKKNNPEALLIGFKLESSMDIKKAKSVTKSLFIKGQCDFVVANSLKQDNYKGFILNKHGQVCGQANNRNVMVKSLLKVIEGNL